MLTFLLFCSYVRNVVLPAAGHLTATLTWVTPPNITLVAPPSSHHRQNSSFWVLRVLTLILSIEVSKQTVLPLYASSYRALFLLLSQRSRYRSVGLFPAFRTGVMTSMQAPFGRIHSISGDSKDAVMYVVSYHEGAVLLFLRCSSLKRVIGTKRSKKSCTYTLPRAPDKILQILRR